MDELVDWNNRREQFENNLKNTSSNKSLSDVVAPATVTIKIDHTEKQFDRQGYLRCAKPKISLGDQVLHLGIHRATLKLNKEKINNLSHLWSSQFVQNIKSHVYTQLKDVLSNCDFEKIKRIIRTQLTAERKLSEISAQSLAAEIGSRLDTVEPLYLDAHATEGKDLTVPYGAELTVTTQGFLKIVRQFSVDRRKKTVKWRNGFDVSVVLNVDASLDPSVNTTDIEVQDFLTPLQPEIEEKEPAKKVEHQLSITEPLQDYHKVQVPPQNDPPTVKVAQSIPTDESQSEPPFIRSIKSISEGTSELIRSRKEEERVKQSLVESLANVLKSIDEPVSIAPNLLSGQNSDVKEAYINGKGMVDMTLSNGSKTTVKLLDLGTKTVLKVFEDIVPKIRSKKLVVT